MRLLVGNWKEWNEFKLCYGVKIWYNLVIVLKLWVREYVEYKNKFVFKREK